MKKLLKSFSFIFLIIGFFIAIYITVEVMINTNWAKQKITDFFKEKMNIEVDIRGECRLKFFPLTGLEANNINIFAKGVTNHIEKCLISLERGELFSKKIVINKVSFESVSDSITGIHIVHTKTEITGKAPIYPMSKEDVFKGDIVTTVTSNLPGKKGHSAMFKGGIIFDQKAEKLSVKGLKISKTEPDIFEELIKNLTIDINIGYKDMKLYADIKGDALYANANFNLAEEVVSGKVYIHAIEPANLIKNCSAELKKYIGNKINLIKNIKHIDISHSLSIKKEDIDINDISLTLNDSVFKGYANLKRGRNPDINFNISLNNIDIDRYFPIAETKVQEKDNKTLDNSKYVNIMPYSKSILKGKINAEKITVKNTSIKKLSFDIYSDINKLEISSLKADIYGGQFYGKGSIIKIDENNLVSVECKLKNIKSYDPLEKIFKREIVTGLGDIAFRLASKGKSFHEIINNIEGLADIDIKNGAIYGVEFKAQKDEISNEDKKEKTPKKQKFDKLTGKVSVTEKKITIEKSELIGNEVRVTGLGYIDIKSKFLDYNMRIDMPPLPTVPYYITVDFSKKPADIKKGIDKVKFAGQIGTDVIKLPFTISLTIIETLFDKIFNIKMDF